MVASTVAATVPAAATATTQPSGASAPDALGADDAPDRTYNDTAFVAMADAGDGDVVAGGQTDLRNSNATVMRIGDDGQTEWTTRFESENATQVVDLAASSDGDVYVLLSEQPGDQRAGQRTGTLRLVRMAGDGDVIWRQSLDATALYGGVSLVESDDGVAIAHRRSEDGGVRLAEYAGGDAIWERTYEIDATPSSLRKTDDGYLLAGTVNFDEPWVLRTTESGRERLNATLPGLEADRVVDAVPTDDGGAVVVGDHRTAFSGAGSMAWAARVDGDGLTRWNRLYDGGGDFRISTVFDTGDGLLLVGQNQAGLSGSAATSLIGIGVDGAQRFSERVDSAVRFTAVTRSGDALRTAGVTEYTRSGYTSVLGTVPIPDADRSADAGLDADVGVTSNETIYRGQNVRIADAGGAEETYDLVRLPGERDEFDPQVVRRVALDDSDSAVLETAMLPGGEYVLRTADGQPVALENGSVTGPAPRADARFSVQVQRFFRVETNRTFVNAAEGERGVSLGFDSHRTDYDVYVSARLSNDDAVDAETLEAVFGDVSGFEGIETVDGESAARIAMGDRDRINASADGFDPGLYEVTVSGVDTRDGGAVATGRLVVAGDSERRLGLVLANGSLSVPAGDEVRTNVSLTNVSNGISAMSVSANRTGEPAFRVRLDLDINASRASASAGLSRREATAGASGFDGDTANGTVRVGSLGVRAESIGRDAISNGTNTVAFRVDWVVDEDGIPYALPDETTVTVEVTDAGNATDGDRRSGSGGASAGSSGSSSGSDA